MRMRKNRLILFISLAGLCAVLYYMSSGMGIAKLNASTYQPSGGLEAGYPVEVYHENQNKSSSCRDKPRIVPLSSPAGSLHVITTCDKFLERIGQLNTALDMLRTKVLQERGNLNWNGPLSGSVNLVDGADDDFIEQLAKYPRVLTVILPWTGENSSRWNFLTDQHNLLLSQYYEWTASEPLCTWIESPGQIGIYFNRTCNRYWNKTAQPQSLYPIYVNMKGVIPSGYWPNNGTEFHKHFHERPLPIVTYLHIITDAIVMGNGNIYSGNLLLAPYGCPSNKDPHVPPNALHQPLYEEIFLISQHWGTGVFHSMLEIVPRLGASLEFLNQNPHIKILTPEGPGGRLGDLMRILGLNPDRMVTEWGRANIAYVPRASYCGVPSLQETQIISKLYHRYIVNNLQPLHRNKLILIRRTGNRRFTQQQAIEKVLQQIASEYNLEFTLFIDNPVPSLHDTMRMFHAAVMVVAPHGAGLSNIVFSQPETYVIEGMCNLPHVNYCFQRTVVILGHHYHAIPSRGGCEGVVDVDSIDIDFLARTYLSIWKGTLHQSNT